MPRDLPDQNTWFRPALPQGTLLDVDWRLELTQELMTMDAPRLRTLRELGPHNLPLAIFDAERLPGDKRFAADLAAVYGPLAEFQVPTMSAHRPRGVVRPARVPQAPGGAVRDRRELLPEARLSPGGAGLSRRGRRRLPEGLRRDA